MGRKGNPERRSHGQVQFRPYHQAVRRRNLERQGLQHQAVILTLTKHSKVREQSRAFYIWAMEIKKTNAARILDRQKISYELIPYKVDENDLGAQHVADSLGEDINQVFKTILVHGDKIGYLVCVVPGNLEVDLKGAAKVSGNKKIDTVPLKDLTPLTGYIRGGCSPLGLKKNFPIFIHETAMQFTYIYVSAGERGLQLKVAPADLVKATRATVGVIARVPPEAPQD